ncbi:MAG: hypothetical protein JST54_00845 [Deltaproteobacteria bacterium]|nr:hypothetical protein [Deltaproteobacteria bacterium]
MIRFTALVLALMGCASTAHLTPKQGDADGAIAQGPGGLSLRAVPNAWHMDPSSVAERFTPLWVLIQNRGSVAYDVTLADIRLIDEQGRIYAAVAPMDVMIATVGNVEVPMSGTLVAEAGTSDVPQLAIVGCLLPVYSPFTPLTPCGCISPPNPSTDPARSNILNRGLAEGRLLPETQAAGFIYFQRAYDAKELHLRIDAQPEEPGEPPVELQVSFAVAH